MVSGTALKERKQGSQVRPPPPPTSLLETSCCPHAVKFILRAARRVEMGWSVFQQFSPIVCVDELEALES